MDADKGETLPSQEGYEPESERILGTSEAGRAASAFMVALTRAARSFLLYDPGNEAIRHFLEAVRTTSEAYFSSFGDLDLKVRPFELAVGPEVVYLDSDRERSLAFRLYRDGVRRIVIGVDVSWQEILKFLEVVSVRFTGVRQTEDDMVVLLWKAGFQHIQIEAVEGVVEDDAAELAVGQASTGHYASVPEDFDLPAPKLPQVRPVLFQPVPSFVLESLVAEDASSALPELCVRLAGELMDGVTHPTSALEMDDVVPIVRELRDFLLAEGTLDPLLGVVRTLLRAPITDPRARALRDELAASFLDERGMTRLLRSMPRDLPEAPPEMLALLSEVPGDHLPTLFVTQSAERGEHVRRVARQLIEHYVPSRVDWMMDQLPVVEDSLAGLLLRAIARVHPHRAIDAVAKVADRVDSDVQLDVLTVLETALLSPTVARFLAQYSGSAHEVVRVRALEIIGKRAVRTLFPPLLDRVKRDALRMSDAEATASGEALLRCDPARAMEVFREWTVPPRFFQFVPPNQKMLHWVAVAGLSAVPGEESERLIGQVMKLAEKQAQPDLQRHCVNMMVRHRRLARGAR